MTEIRQVIIPHGVSSAVTAEEANALAELARDKVVLELGAWEGFSTVVLASVAGLVVSVDWHQGDDHAGRCDTWPAFTASLARFGVADRVRAIRGRFEDELPRLAAEGFRCDGIFLDAHHSEKSVTGDLGLALPLVRPGGFIAFHDYGRGPATGHPDFAVTEVADRLVGITGRAGFLGWGFLPEESRLQDEPA